MKKGFTLIELLAVIVILAIISLIAVPIVVNIINNAKKSSKKESIKLYLDTVEKSVTRRMLTKPTFNPVECTINENKKIKCGEEEIEIDIQGEVPSEGTTSVSKIDLLATYILTTIRDTSYTGTCTVTGTNRLACGEENTIDTSYTISGGTITFENGEIIEYKNVNVDGTYYHKESGKEEKTSNHEIYATLVKDAGTRGLSVGDEYTYRVNDTDTFNFYVLSIEETEENQKVNLIMDRNICNDGTVSYTSTNNYCRCAWESNNVNANGPITAMIEIGNGTRKMVNNIRQNYNL